MRIVGTPFVDRATRRNGSSDLLLLPLLFLGRENAPETNDHWRHCLRVGMWDRVAINSVGFDGQWNWMEISKRDCSRENSKFIEILFAILLPNVASSITVS